ncbi:hypothetical protein [Streptomyces roseoverticillatus]|uniref:Uncharacterized protein n=1 Tax=Streptomyces roseoverticillatus TaxID=66429 RepID=A0ABV3J0B7_9ACTN
MEEQAWRSHAAPGEPYYTTNTCSGCGSVVLGVHGRWTCASCGTCSPYQEPPEGWASEIAPEGKGGGTGQGCEDPQARR